MAAVSSSWKACILTDIPLQYAFPFFRRPPPICSLSLLLCRGFEDGFYVSIKSMNCNFIKDYGVNMVQKRRHYQIISNEHVLWMCDCKIVNLKLHTVRQSGYGCLGTENQVNQNCLIGKCSARRKLCSKNHFIRLLWRISAIRLGVRRKKRLQKALLPLPAIVLNLNGKRLWLKRKSGMERQEAEENCLYDFIYINHLEVVLNKIEAV